MSNILYEWIMDVDGNVVVGEHVLSQEEIVAIFSGGSGTSTTSNGGMWTWTIPNANNNNQSTPTVKVALYRRSTHDEKGNYKQFTPTQEQLWKDLAVVATMTNAL